MSSQKLELELTGFTTINQLSYAQFANCLYNEATAVASRCACRWGSLQEFTSIYDMKYGASKKVYVNVLD